MDARNLSDLRRLASQCPAPRITLLRSYDPSAPSGADVPDPYAGGASGFEDVLDICERACRGLLETL
jgi:protein-tyrosine phosphatase